MESNKILQTAMLAGEILLKNGAETYRVEDTIRRILTAEKIEIADAFVTTTGIFSSIGDSDGNVTTLIRRVQSRTTHLEKIALVNDLSRSYVDKKITIETAMKELKRIDNLPTYGKIPFILATATACGFFTILFDGTIGDIPAAFVVGLVLGATQLFLNYKKLASFLINLFCGMLVALLALIITALNFGNDLNVIISGSIMPLVPGVALTNAIRDTLAGDYVSGTARLLDALLTAIAIASGVGFVLIFSMPYIFGGL